VGPVAHEIRRQLLLTKAFGTSTAFGNPMLEAVLEEERAFLVAEIAGSPTVEMDHVVAVDRYGLVGQDGLLTAMALRLSHRRAPR